MSRTSGPLPGPLARRAFTRAEALAAGVDVNRLRRGDLDSPWRSVRVPRAAPDDPIALHRALLRTLPPGTAFSHTTALRLLGVEIPRELDDDAVHVRLPVAGTRPRRRGITAHAVREIGPLVRVGGLPVSAPHVAWFDCARLPEVDVDTLVVLGDATLRRRTSVSSLAKLASAVDATLPRAPGRARARRALLDVRPRTDSNQETRTRLLLVRNGLPCPEVNEPIVSPSGKFLALPDMLFRAQRTVVEYDGEVHRVQRALWVRDIHRRERLQAAGWTVITVTADDLRQRPLQVVSRVRSALLAATTGDLRSP